MGQVHTNLPNIMLVATKVHMDIKEVYNVNLDAW